MESKLFNVQSAIHITCPNKISPYLRKEVEELGYTVKAELPAGIEMEGTLEDCIRLNLNLQTAHRVLYLIRKFKVNSPDQLYHAASDVKWEQYIHADGYFSIISHVEHATINNSTFASLKCKDAIADYFLQKFGSRPNSGPDRNRAVIFLHWKGEDASLYIDTSGEALSKHGYRKLPHKAPLQESLASAMILASSWDHHSPFVNPMCGSGTLAIEAALIATNRKPGLLRSNYGFMHIKYYNEAKYRNIRSELKSKIKKTVSPVIASDIDPMAIQAARQNAATAGVDHLISFHLCDFRDTPVPSQAGVVMLNPEYGERLGEESKLEEVYKSIGDFFKQSCHGYTGYIFTGNPSLSKKIGLKTKRKLEFYNSTIECRLLEFELYSGTRKNKKESEQQGN